MLSKQLFVGIWILSIAGAISILPYVYFLGMVPTSISFFYLFLINVINSAIIYGMACSISYFLLQRIDLKPFDIKKPLTEIVYPGLFWGVFVGLALFISDKIIFKNSTLTSSIAHPPFWAGILASFYGAINEEVLCRLFLLTLIYFILNKIFKNNGKYKVYMIWISIILVALFFGIGHLPAAFKIISSPSAFEIFRILFLNGIAGLTFGWLYCTRGFWTAVFAHFIADLMIHVFLIF